MQCILNAVGYFSELFTKFYSSDFDENYFLNVFLVFIDVVKIKKTQTYLRLQLQ